MFFELEKRSVQLPPKSAHLRSATQMAQAPLPPQAQEDVAKLNTMFTALDTDGVGRVDVAGLVARADPVRSPEP